MTAECERYLLQQVSCQASLLVATAGFSKDHWDDLRQELALDFLRRAPRFDPVRGDWQAFARGVVRNHAAVLAKRRNTQAGREVLAGDLAGGAGEADATEPLLDRVRSDDSTDALNLAIDIERVLSRLPSHLEILARLLTTFSIVEICVRTRRSRTRTYQLIRDLRSAFIDAGFRPPASRRHRGRVNDHSGRSGLGRKISAR